MTKKHPVKKPEGFSQHPQFSYWKEGTWHIQTNEGLGQQSKLN